MVLIVIMVIMIIKIKIILVNSHSSTNSSNRNTCSDCDEIVMPATQEPVCGFMASRCLTLVSWRRSAPM